MEYCFKHVCFRISSWKPFSNLFLSVIFLTVLITEKTKELFKDDDDNKEKKKIMSRLNFSFPVSNFLKCNL